MSKTAKKFVKINPNRGYGEHMMEVTGEQGGVYHIRDPKTGQNFSIYKALTFQDFDTKKATSAARVEFANNIGRKK